MIRALVLLVSVGVGLGATGMPVQTGTSAASVRTLVALLDKAALDSFAVKVDGEPNVYVSALHVPNVQLLVVSGKYLDPPALDARIAAGDYRGAYTDHNASTVREGKLFVMDMQANGLTDKPVKGQPFDIAYESGVTTTMFNGDWRAQKLSEREYQRRFADIEARYAQMIARLIAGLEQRRPPVR